MNVKKLRLGLIGKDVSQSDSERIHIFILKQLGIECEYQRFSVGKDDFDSAMRCLLGDFDGFNVTIPYKRDAMEYVDDNGNVIGLKVYKGSKLISEYTITYETVTVSQDVAQRIKDLNAVLTVF